MSLKHNPFDNSYKGSLVRRKKVFEAPTPEELSVKADMVSSSANIFGTSLEQHSNNSETEPETSLEQHSNAEVAEDSRFRNITKTETKTVLETSLEHNSNITRTTRGFSAVVGLQRKILDYFFTKAQAAGSRTTGKIYTEVLAEMLACSVETVRTSVQRLETKGFIIRQEFKRGRGGFSVFEIGVETYQNLVIENNTRTTFKHNENITTSQTKTETKTSLPSSSRDFLIKESTSTQPVADLSTIDLGRVQHLGITTSVLARCIELYPVLRPEQLEGLVFRFAEFAKDPKNKVQNARGFFISLAEQASKGQVPLDHIETPNERLMRLYVEQQKEAKSRRVDAERAAQDFECETWIESLTPEIKLTLVPETAILKAGTAAHAAMLKKHFAENLWPERRKRILEGAPAVDATS